MRFRHLPVVSFQDVTHDLEQIQTEWPQEGLSQFAVQRIAQEQRNHPWAIAAAQTAREANKEFEASATFNTLVLLQINSKAAEVQTVCSLKSGGVQVGTVSFPKLAEEAIATVTVPVAAGRKWEVTVTAGTISALNSSYTFLT